MLNSVFSLLFPLMLGCAAHAHVPPPSPVTAVTVATTPAVVSISWVWVNPKPRRGHVRDRGHWYHPHYGKSYRPHLSGAPPHRPHAQSHWVPGHWEGQGRNRHWVNGRWK